VTSKRRREGLEKELEQAQADYEECLIAALQTCAAGQWGLFGVNDAAAKREFSRPLSKEAKDLRDRGKSIAELRSRLGYADPFALHEHYLELRKTARASNSPGEPKLATAFLEHLTEIKQ
jgi:hypothetical protein